MGSHEQYVFLTTDISQKFIMTLDVVVFDFYTNLNEFYGVIAECCTQQSCSTMSAGQAYVHLLLLES